MIVRPALALAALALPLAACNGHDAPPSGEASSTAAAPDAKPGLSLSEGRLVLPAVKGNPGAAYFKLANGSAKDATIAAVDVTGAGMAMLHQTMAKDGHSTMAEMSDPVVKARATLSLKPGAAHVMVFDLPADLKPGGTVEMTVTFADGDKLSAPLSVVSPGSM